MAKNQKSNKKRKPEEEAVSSSNEDNVASSQEVKKAVEEEEMEAKKSEVTSPKSKNKKDNSKKKEKEVNKRSDNKKGIPKKKEKKLVKVEETENEESSALYEFPMKRVSRIIKSGDPDIRMFSEAIFVINKASEKFLELFSEEAYACSSQESKRKVDYKQLSSVVPRRRRFDFLSDFVPEKVKAEDALKEVPPVET